MLHGEAQGRGGRPRRTGGVEPKAGRVPSHGRLLQNFQKFQKPPRAEGQFSFDNTLTYLLH